HVGFLVEPMQELVVVVEAVRPDHEVGVGLEKVALEEEKLLVARIAWHGRVDDLHGGPAREPLGEVVDEAGLVPGDGVAEDQDPEASGRLGYGDLGLTDG